MIEALRILNELLPASMPWSVGLVVLLLASAPWYLRACIKTAREWRDYKAGH